MEIDTWEAACAAAERHAAQARYKAEVAATRKAFEAAVERAAVRQREAADRERKEKRDAAIRADIARNAAENKRKWKTAEAAANAKQYRNESMSPRYAAIHTPRLEQLIEELSNEAGQPIRVLLRSAITTAIREARALAWDTTDGSDACREQAVRGIDEHAIGRALIFEAAAEEQKRRLAAAEAAKAAAESAAAAESNSRPVKAARAAADDAAQRLSAAEIGQLVDQKRRDRGYALLDGLESKSMEELKGICKRNFLRTTGGRQELRDRIHEYAQRMLGHVHESGTNLDEGK